MKRKMLNAMLALLVVFVLGQSAMAMAKDVAGLEIGSGTIATIITLLFTILAALGVTLKKVFAILTALDESADVVKVVRRVLDDRKVTEAEEDEVIKEINEADGAWKNVKLMVSK